METPLQGRISCPARVLFYELFDKGIKRQYTGGTFTAASKGTGELSPCPVYDFKKLVEIPNLWGEYIIIILYLERKR